MTATATAPSPQPILSDELLNTFASRASGYDRENRFFSEDFEDLRQPATSSPSPTEFGGHGAGAGRLRRTCSGAWPTAPPPPRSPPTCTSTGSASPRTYAPDGRHVARVAAARSGARARCSRPGHGEAGNDLPLLLSTHAAERVDGGYRFNGHKMFGSLLSPVWTRLGHARHGHRTPTNPRSSTPSCRATRQGYTIKETWDTLGMRATRSDDTILDGAFVPDSTSRAVLPAGGADLFILGVFAWALPNFGEHLLRPGAARARPGRRGGREEDRRWR